MKTIAEQLVKKMLDAYPYGIFTIESAFEFIENGGQVNTSAFRIWMETNGYWRDYFDKEPDDHLTIKSAELSHYLQTYGCADEEDLDKTLYYEYNIALKIVD